MEDMPEQVIEKPAKKKKSLFSKILNFLTYSIMAAGMYFIGGALYDNCPYFHVKCQTILYNVDSIVITTDNDKQIYARFENKGDAVKIVFKENGCLYINGDLIVRHAFAYNTIYRNDESK